jgi:hypothetical protein
MAMQSFGGCPWCGARIDLRNKGRMCTCPVCACTFTRNPGKWKIGVPVAVAVAALLWIFLPVHGRLAACLGAVGILMFTANTSRHTIVSGGRTDLTAGEAKQHKAKGKESKWFIVAVALLLVTVLVVVLLGFLARR